MSGLFRRFRLGSGRHPRRHCLGVRRLGLAAAAVMLLLTPAPASAQFDTPNRAFHKATAFPLDGQHLTVPCESCHINDVYKGTPTMCAGCHWVRRQDDVYKTRLGIQCEACHRTTTWSATSWDHAAATGMPLNGAHRTLGCDGCHKDAQFTGGSTQCISCHRRDFEATQSPNHLAAGFSTACESCHSASDATFTRARFDHNATYPLIGVHATVSCQSCHTGGKYQGTPRECVGCHRVDFDRTTSPSHVAAGFSTACESCHRPTDAAWRGVRFDHAAIFPLSGPHATAACETCHAGGRFKGTPRECVGCHRADFDATTNPNHAAAGFSTACETCHRDTDPVWRSTSGAFEHNQFFRLLGPHTFQECGACHRDGRFAGTPRECVGCHRDDYDRTAAPVHSTAGFSTSCDGCHSASAASWGSGSFNHASVFPLLGQHAAQTCTTCHTGGVYRGTPRDCVGCHRDDYDRTAAPSHSAAGFPTTCEGCHNASAAAWTGAAFDHNAIFPLAGPHATAACATCHVGGRYAGTPTTCYGCHRPDYEAARDPNHLTSGFPTTCESCHRNTDSSWDQGRFTHTWFPIASGRHSGNPCSACHTDPSNDSTFTCITCHGRSTTDGHHREVSGYRYESTACYACHPNGRAGVPSPDHPLPGRTR